MDFGAYASFWLTAKSSIIIIVFGTAEHPNAAGHVAGPIRDPFWFLCVFRSHRQRPNTLLQKSKMESVDEVADVTAHFLSFFGRENFCPMWIQLSTHLHKRLSICKQQRKRKKNGSRCIEYNEYVHCGTATNSINRSSGSARPECALWATSCEGRVLFAFMRTYECVTINYMQSVTWPRLNTYKYMHLSHFSYTVETNEPSNAPTARRRQTKK